MMLRVFAFCCSLILIGALPRLEAEDTQQERVLRSAHEVAWTPYENDQAPLQVDILATVTYIDSNGTVFLEDESGGTFLRASTARANDFSLGQQLHVRGPQARGLYVHGVNYDQVDIVGQVQLPAAQALTWQQMIGGAYHYQRAQVTGIVRSAAMTGEHSSSLWLAFEDQILELRISQSQEPLERLINAKVQVEGLLAGAINDRGQLLVPYLQVASEHYFQVLTPTPSDPFDIPTSNLNSLETKPLPLGAQHRLKLQGVIHRTQVFGGFLLSTKDGSTLVFHDLPEEFQTGDDVEMVGFPKLGAFSLCFENAEVRKIGTRQSVAPLAVPDAELKNGAADLSWVRLKGQALSTPSSHGTFELRVGSHLIGINATPEQLRDIHLGATVELSGALRVTETYNDDYRARPAAFVLQVSHDDTIRLLSSGPWFTPSQLKWSFAILTLFATGFALWVFLLRRQVRLQLALIQRKIEVEVLVEERARIAREFHDTLEQELAGASIRLDTVKAVVKDPRAIPLLEDIRSLLVKMQHETRDFVLNLRESFEAEGPLNHKLSTLLEHLQATTSYPIEFESENLKIALPTLTQHHLLRITREAVHNAIKYAHPSRISVHLRELNEGLELSIEDDGSGFETSPETLPSGHYGLKGLHERAAKIRAKLQIHSKPGHGTRVSLYVPRSFEA